MSKLLLFEFEVEVEVEFELEFEYEYEYEFEVAVEKVDRSPVNKWSLEPEETENKLSLNLVGSLWSLEFALFELALLLTRWLKDTKSTGLEFFGRTKIDLNELEILDKRAKIAFGCWSGH